MSQKTSGHEPVNRRTASALMRGADCRPGAGSRNGIGHNGAPIVRTPEFLDIVAACMESKSYWKALHYQRMIITRELKGGAE